MIAASFEPSALACPAMGLGLVVLGALWMLASWTIMAERRRLLREPHHGLGGAEASYWVAGRRDSSVAGAIAAAAVLPATAIALAQTPAGEAPSRARLSASSVESSPGPLLFGRLWSGPFLAGMGLTARPMRSALALRRSCVRHFRELPRRPRAR
jgi:hypothetical protein